MTGCAGIGGMLSISHTQSIDNPSISKDYGRISSDKHCDGSKPINAYTLKIFWGLPDSINILGDNKAEWVYKASRYNLESSSKAWRGLFLLIGIVPVPLALPIGAEEIRILLEDGVVKNAYSEESQDLILGFLLFCMGPDGLGIFMPIAKNKLNHYFLEDSKNDLLKHSVKPGSILICKNSGKPYLRQKNNGVKCSECSDLLISVDDFYKSKPSYTQVDNLINEVLHSKIFEDARIN